MDRDDDGDDDDASQRSIHFVLFRFVSFACLFIPCVYKRLIRLGFVLIHTLCYLLYCMGWSGRSDLRLVYFVHLLQNLQSTDRDTPTNTDIHAYI